MDLPVAVARVLRRLRPRALLVAETELWPELFHACGVRGIPVHLVTALSAGDSSPRPMASGW